MKKFTFMFMFIGALFAATHALAQTPAPPARPAVPAAAAPAAPPAPPAPQRERQPINVRIELAISESGGNAPGVRKNIVAVVGEGFNSFVRESGMQDTDKPNAPPQRSMTPLNLDARPEILSNGKIRLTCTIQYQSSPQNRDDQTRRINTDIKQNLVLNLDSGKALTISEATDPITDRKVTVEVTATILK